MLMFSLRRRRQVLFLLIVGVASVFWGGDSFLIVPREVRRVKQPREAPSLLSGRHIVCLYQAEKDTITKKTTGQLAPMKDDDNSVSRYIESKFAISEETMGVIILATVPLVWGTYVPAVDRLYEIDPAVPGFVFSATYLSVAALTTFGLLAAPSFRRSINVDSDIADTNTFDQNTAERSWLSRIPFRAGVELGTYLFMGSILQILGLKTIAADRAGFLIQMTTILVPVVEYSLKGRLLAVPLRTWSACGLALAGITVLGFDDSTTSALFSSFSQGDFLTLGAAFCYTLHVVRLGRWANESSPLELAAAKATMEMALALGLLAYLVMNAGAGDITGDGLQAFVQESGRDVIGFFDTVQERIATGTLSSDFIPTFAGTTIWCGWAVMVWVLFAQGFGQRFVSPTDANLIYSSQPIFTALFAYLLLGETMQPNGFAGGALILAAVYLVATKPTKVDEDIVKVDKNKTRV